MDKKELRKQVKVLKSQYSLEQKVEMSRPLWKELEQTDFFWIIYPFLFRMAALWDWWEKTEREKVPPSAVF